VFSGKYDLWLEERQKLVHLNNDPPLDAAILSPTKEKFDRAAAVKRMVKVQEEQSRSTYNKDHDLQLPSFRRGDGSLSLLRLPQVFPACKDVPQTDSPHSEL
jgi:hypothetical protein